MILNGFPVDPDRLKIVILSSPKTGNTWLRWLLHEAYKIQMVELPLEWALGCASLRSCLFGAKIGAEENRGGIPLYTENEEGAL